MIKDDLAKRIAATFGLSLNLAGKIVQTFLDELVYGLIADSNVELRRFGVFAVKRQAARTITLPSDKKVTRPAQKVVTFTASPEGAHSRKKVLSITAVPLKIQCSLGVARYNFRFLGVQARESL